MYTTCKPTEDSGWDTYTCRVFLSLHQQDHMLEILKGIPSGGGGKGDAGDFPIKIMVMLHVVGKFESAFSEDKRILFCGQGSNLF